MRCFRVKKQMLQIHLRWLYRCRLRPDHAAFVSSTTAIQCTSSCVFFQSLLSIRDGVQQEQQTGGQQAKASELDNELFWVSEVEQALTIYHGLIDEVMLTL